MANLETKPAGASRSWLHSGGLPIGLQLIAPWGHEAALLDAADHLSAGEELSPASK